MYTLALATCGTVPVALALLPGETGMCSNFAVAQRTPLPAPDVESALTRSQQARRRRVIEAAGELAAEGGDDAGQMRDVAIRRPGALGNIYRDFTATGHLLSGPPPAGAP